MNRVVRPCRIDYASCIRNETIEIVKELDRAEIADLEALGARRGLSRQMLTGCRGQPALRYWRCPVAYACLSTQKRSIGSVSLR